MRIIGWIATLALVVLVFWNYGLAWGLVALLLLALIGLLKVISEFRVF